MGIEQDNAIGECRMFSDTDGYLEWDSICSFDVWVEQNWLTFRIPFDEIPFSISGRYLSIDSFWGLEEWDMVEADLNRTHIQVGLTSTILGQVLYSGYRGGPIFVRAFTDLKKPDDSIVAYTVLNYPGSYVLNDAAIGISCYIEAFCPLFGDYNPAALDALKVSTIRRVLTKAQTVSRINLSLYPPAILKNGICQYKKLQLPYEREAFFAFDAIEGANYSFELTEFEGNHIVSLLGRDGGNELGRFEPWEMESMSWLCPVDGRYYLKVSRMGWDAEISDYRICVRTEVNCPDADISGHQWAGVKDCRVDMYDFAFLASQWINRCSEPYWCEGSDYNQSGSVNLSDLLFLFNNMWMTGNRPDLQTD